MISICTKAFIFITELFSDECITPRNINGRCTLLSMCSPFIDILKKKPISPEDSDYLRKSGCGFEGMDPKVCCPLSTTAVTEVSTTNANGKSVTDNYLFFY